MKIDEQGGHIRYDDGGNVLLNKKFYHSSDENLSLEKILFYSDEEDYRGNSFYITDDIDYSKNFGKNLYEVTLSKFDELKESKKNIKAISNYFNLDYEDFDSVIDVLQYLNDNYEKEKVRIGLVNLGFDGLIEKNKYYTQISLWNKKAIKSLTEGVLLAPNEQPSNLTPEQYRLVRTSAFKKWFGDWENSPETASKVVDENGEPLVVHHSYIQKKNKFKPFNVFKTKLTYEIGTHFGSKEQADTNITFKVRDRGYDRDTWETKTYECFLNIRKIRRLNDRRHWLPKTIFGNLYPRKKIDWFDFEKGKENIELFLKEIKGNVDGLIYNNDFEHGGDSYIVFEPNQIKLADGSNTTFDGSNPDIRYADGGNVENKETYKKWKSLVNMSNSELEKFYNSQEGKDAGLSSKEASEQGISSGRESARWIMKMKETPMSDWTPTMWTWAKKQISFISRMSGNRGDLYDEKGNKTRKHTSLLIWGHNPKKYEQGANIENETNKNKMDKTIEISTSEYKFSEFYEWFKNYVPASLYNEEWVSEMRTLNNLIKDNNVEEKVTFTDDRLVLISNFALCYSDVIKGGLREWWIVRRYLQQYTDNNSIQGTDLLEFVDKYIGYTYTDAIMNEETLGRVETLKSVLSKYVKDDSIMIPYFVKNEIMSGAKEQEKEIIVRKEAPKKESVDLSAEEKWQGLKDFAEMMMEDAEGEALEKWEGLYEFCELMLEK